MKVAVAHRLLLGVLVLVAAAPFLWLLDDARSRLAVVGAVVVAGLLSAALRARPAAVSAAGGLLVLTVYEIGLVAGADLPTPAVLAGAWEAVTESGTALLAGPRTTSSPAAPAAGPALLAFTAAFAATELATRSRLPAAGAVPAVLLHGAALVLCGPDAPGGWLPTLAMVLLTLAALRPDRRPPRPVTAAAVLASVTVTAVVGAQLLMPAAASRYDVHAAYGPPPRPVVGVTPLSEMAGSLAAPGDPVVFRLRLEGGGTAPGPHRLPIARLDHYDGESWGLAPGHSFVPVGRPDGADTTGSPVVQAYTLTADYPSAFLPRLDHPVGARSDEELLHWDPASGMVRREGGEANLEYAVASRVDRADEAAAPPGPSLTELPALPTALEQYLDEFPGTDPVSRIERVAADLRTQRFGYSREAVAGHSTQRLSAFVLASPLGDGAVERVGSSEQSAALLAVLARQLRLPSRVVVGYELAEVPAGIDIEVRARQIHAWVEVQAPGRGWLELDPTDRRERRPAEPPAPATATTQAEGGRAPVPPARPPTDPSNATDSDDPEAASAPRSRNELEGPCGPGDGSCRPLALGWPGVVLAVTLSSMAAIAGPRALRWLRRLRRRTGGPPLARTLGAWDETTERLRAHGVPVGSVATPAQLAERCRESLGDDVAATLAAWRPLLDAALYARADPSAHLAELAWAADAANAEAVRRASPRRTRLRAALLPRRASRRPGAQSMAGRPGTRARRRAPVAMDDGG